MKCECAEVSVRCECAEVCGVCVEVSVGCECTEVSVWGVSVLR